MNKENKELDGKLALITGANGTSKGSLTLAGNRFFTFLLKLKPSFL